MIKKFTTVFLLVLMGSGILHAENIAVMDQKACLRCHGMENFNISDPSEKTTRKLHIDPMAYSRSVHSKFACQDCHPKYTAYPHKAEWSAQRPTCAQTCHQPSLGSITGQMHDHSKIGLSNLATRHFHVAGQTHDHPGCVDCHGGDAHAITSAKKWTGSQREAICTRCHGDQAMMAKFQVNAAEVGTYHYSFHGKAHMLGMKNAPVCDDCHTAHNIRPANDPASTIAKSNLHQTCGRCHKDTGSMFTLGNMHIGAVTGKDRPVIWTRIIYNLFVWAVILQFIALIILDIVRRYLNGRRRIVDHDIPEQHHKGYIERFTLDERIQHIILIVSFFLLAATGAPLIFPNSEVSRLAVNLMGGMAMRGILHRIGAVALLGLGFYHIIWGFTTKEGKREIRELLPTPKDIVDALQLLEYYFGLTSKPKYTRYSWIEKFEYFGLVWGSVIMAVSGLMLWFKAQSTIIFPKWALDIATVVHSYEARLAILTILIWHFYNVIFSPDVFPMNMTWLTGKISVKKMIEEHPLEYAELKKSPKTKRRAENQ